MHGNRAARRCSRGIKLFHMMGMTRLRRVVNVLRTVLPSFLICSLISLGTCNCGRLLVRDGGVNPPSVSRLLRPMRA